MNNFVTRVTQGGGGSGSEFDPTPLTPLILV